MLDLLLNLWYNIYIIDNNQVKNCSFNSTKSNLRVSPERQLFPRRDGSRADISLSVVTNAIKTIVLTTIQTLLKWGQKLIKQLTTLPSKIQLDILS